MLFDDFFALNRTAEARPAAARVEFIERTEKRLAGNDVHVKAWFMVVPEFVVEGGLRAGVLGDVKLHCGQFLFELGRRRFLKVFHILIGKCGWARRQIGHYRLGLSGRTAAKGGSRDAGKRSEKKRFSLLHRARISCRRLIANACNV